jgi:hypothetical protein
MSTSPQDTKNTEGDYWWLVTMWTQMHKKLRFPLYNEMCVSDTVLDEVVDFDPVLNESSRVWHW